MRPRTVLGLLPADLARLARDELLAWMPAVPVIMALAVRLGASPVLAALGLRAELAQEWSARIDVTAFGIVVPVLIGTVVGFMLLGEKEDRVWDALAVTPVSLRGYLAWRAAGASLVAVGACAMCLRIGGLNDLGIARVCGVALAAAPLAGATALGLACWTTDTVQGFAAVKLSLVVLILPAVLPGAGIGGWLLAVVPSWWPARAYREFAAGNASAPAWAAGSILVCGAVAGTTLRRTTRHGAPR